MLVIFIIMDYMKIHNDLINRAKNRQLTGYKETHHILPKCMGGKNNKDNLVDLTAKEHWLVHLLLIEIYPDNNRLKIAMSFMMSKRHPKRKLIVSGRQFERIRKMVSIAHADLLRGKKRKPFSDEHKANNNPMHNNSVIKKFRGASNPNSKKVKNVESGIHYKTINDCIKNLKINSSLFYKMVKENKIVYL